MKSFRVKKYVVVKDEITPGQLMATHKRFWENIKDKPLRVLSEDKTEYGVQDVDGNVFNVKKIHADVVVNPKEVPVG